MSRIRSRFNIQITLSNSCGTVIRRSYRKKSAVVQLIKLNRWQKAYLRVSYGRGNGNYNSGSYYNENALLQALDHFTEHVLVDSLIS